MREHRYQFEMPHSAARIWALFQDYDRWTDYAPMVKRVDVLYPGDADHNERYNIQKAPFKWFEGPIYKFINKNNEDSMRRASAYLSAHPEYRADLTDAE
jgi:hypothetical protein